MKIIFLDIETNGLDPQRHVPIEIGILIYDLDKNDEFEAFTSFIALDAEDKKNSCLTAMQVNGIVDRIPKDAPEIDMVERAIEMFFLQNNISSENCFFLCQNPTFDRPFFHKIIPQIRMNHLGWPYHWLDLASMYWFKSITNGLKLQSTKCILSKDSIAKCLGMDPEPMPHTAIQGAAHLAKCYLILTGNWKESKLSTIRK